MELFRSLPIELLVQIWAAWSNAKLFGAEGVGCGFQVLKAIPIHHPGLVCPTGPLTLHCPQISSSFLPQTPASPMHTYQCRSRSIMGRQVHILVLVSQVPWWHKCALWHTGDTWKPVQGLLLALAQLRIALRILGQDMKFIPDSNIWTKFCREYN